jgi:hypothetical protein
VGLKVCDLARRSLSTGERIGSSDSPAYAKDNGADAPTGKVEERGLAGPDRIDPPEEKRFATKAFHRGTRCVADPFAVLTRGKGDLCHRKKMAASQVSVRTGWHTENIWRDIESENALVDIPYSEVAVGRTPVPPEGYEIVRIDVVVRLRRKAR